MSRLITNGTGKTDYYGSFGSALRGAFSGEVFEGFNVTQDSPLGMTVKVNPGIAMIPTGSAPGQEKYLARIDTSGGESVTISTANGSNPRKDLIVAYYDAPGTPNTTDPNNPGDLKLLAVAGTPAATPAAPNTAAIQAAIGGAKPYIVLAEVLVGTSVTQITSSNVTDMRTMAKPRNPGDWMSIDETLTYSSWTSATSTAVITVPIDATSKYSVGMAVRFSQTTGGTKYGRITAVTSNSLTVYMLSGSSLSNETITSPVYSAEYAPIGLPGGDVTSAKIAANIYDLAEVNPLSLSTTAATKWTVTIPATALPGAGNYVAELTGHLAVGFGGNTTAKDAIFDVQVDGSTTGVYSNDCYITQQAIATFTVTGAIHARLILQAGVDHIVTIRGRVSSTAGSSAAQSPRSHISVRVIGKA